MLVILSSLFALASAPVTAIAPKAEAPPAAAAVAKPPKKNENCVVIKKGRLFGHDVTHVKCEDPKPTPKTS